MVKYGKVFKKTDLSKFEANSTGKEQVEAIQKMTVDDERGEALCLPLARSTYELDPKVECSKMSKNMEMSNCETDSNSTGKEQEEDNHKEVNSEEGELPLAIGGETIPKNHIENTNKIKSTNDVNKEVMNNENRRPPKLSSLLEDEISLDEIPQEKKKPKKVISTKDRHNFFNFFNMKEKERKELEEKEKSKKLKSKEEKKKDKEKRIAEEKLKDVFKLIW